MLITHSYSTIRIDYKEKGERIDYKEKGER